MKIAISSTGQDLTSQIDPRFGRSPYFIFIDPETMQFDRIPNSPHSLDIFLENASKAPFDEAYIDKPLYPVCTLIEER